MSTPQPLHSAPDSPQHVQPHASPTPPSLPLNLPLHLNVVNVTSREPPHFSSLIGKNVCLDKNHNVVVEEVIAEGGFGVIFLVKNPDKVKFALKRVVVNSVKDYEGVLGEVAVMSLVSPKTPHLLASLTHVVASYGASTYEVQNLMPLCSKNLLQVASLRMQKSLNFETPEILQILVHVSSGLQFLHNSTPPIIHRDIKIENILLLDDNYVLSDFGSATCKYWDPQVDSISAIQEDLDKNTTLQYRSPEMVDLYGGRGAISVASDVWAIGVCAFKLMTFKDPFESILAIQNRNLNWCKTKSRYPDNLVLLVECLLAEHQSVRPSVEEVIKLATSGANSDWGPVQACYSRIAEDKKSREEASVKKPTNTANIVMETTVTPRQRPKRNLGGTPAAAVASAVIIPPVLAPPKSPKPVSPSAGNVDNARFFSPPSTTPQNTISPTQQAATPSPTPQQQPPQPAPQPWPPQQGGSYNPFDDDYRAPPSCDNQQDPADPSVVTNDDPEFDVFANAPFDYFKYQPIMMSAGETEEQHYVAYGNYAANNPFLYPDQDFAVHSYDLSNNNAATLATGVCNLSFDEGAANNLSNVSSDT